MAALQLLVSADAGLWNIIGVSFAVSLQAIVFATPPSPVPRIMPISGLLIPTSFKNLAVSLILSYIIVNYLFKALFSAMKTGLNRQVING